MPFGKLGKSLVSGLVYKLVSYKIEKTFHKMTCQQDSQKMRYRSLDRIQLMK